MREQRPDDQTRRMNRRTLLRGAGVGLLGLALAGQRGAEAVWQEVEVPVSDLARQMSDPLPSWNKGPRKQAILDFVAAATDESTVAFVPVPDRIATFDMDGTLWIEMPLYTESTFTVAHLQELAPQHPEWKTEEPFAKLITGDWEAMITLTNDEWEAVMGASQNGLTIQEYGMAAAEGLAHAKHPRLDRLYTDLVYQPMLEVMAYLRQNEFRTYIVSGSGQIFMRGFAEATFGVPPEQVIGTANETTYTMGDNGIPLISIDTVNWVDDNFAGKAEDIELFIGRRPAAAQ